MSDSNTESPASPTDVALAVRNLLPQLRGQARTGVGLMGGALVASLAIAVLILSADNRDAEAWKFAIIAVGVGVVLAIVARNWTVRRQESLVMPVLAKAVGLSYQKDAKAFLRALPARLLPKGIKTGEDLVSGSLGAHQVQMAEVKVETGGKNSRTLFAGLVARFPNRTAMPAFFVAREDKTRPGIFFGGDLSTNGLYQQNTVTGGGGARYGVWTSWSGQTEPPALAAVVQAVTRIEDQLGRGTQLYAATSNGEETHVALTHSRNLFRVGGMFPNESDLFEDVRAAMQDLSVPLTLAKALIDAEKIATEKAGATK
jgi:hypothetical protein